MPPTSEYATIDVFRMDSPQRATVIVESLRVDVLPALAGLETFRTATVQVALDGATVVSYVRWTGPPPGAPTGVPLVPTMSFTGALVAGLDGPAAGKPVGWTVTALRPVSGPEDAGKRIAMLVRSGSYKQDIAGFVGAEAFLDAEATMFVNCPQWTNREAFDHYMADPRVQAGRPPSSAQEQMIQGEVVYIA